MNTIARWDQSQGLTLRDQVNRLFDDSFTRDRSARAGPGNVGRHP